MVKGLITHLKEHYKQKELGITKLEPGKTYMLVFPASVLLEDLAQISEYLKAQKVNAVIVQADSVKIIELE